MTAQARVAVVTGASSGIGKAAAKALAADGWHVIAVGRDPARAVAAEAEISAASPDGAVTMVRADLSRLADAERLARDIAALTPRVDLLVNNAGGMCTGRVITEEGLEESFVGNHLGPFLLTERLLPLLRVAAADAAPGSVRILNTSSDASEYIPDLKWDDLQQLGGEFSTGYAYCGVKLANVLHARGLAKRLADTGIVAHAYDPGAIDSNFFTHAPADTQERTKDLAKGSVEDGADTLLWLATAEEPGQSSGGYFHKRAPREPNRLALDDAAVERLWRESESLLAGVLG
jgi:NAD(P)-dependent dehydrogenase (short-subunit alcohol dehydrogenase family)